MYRHSDATSLPFPSLHRPDHQLILVLLTFPNHLTLASLYPSTLPLPQVQLRVQNVQTLQSLNGETKALQRKLQQQLKELMLLTLADGELFPPSPNAAAPVQPPAPPVSTPSSSSGPGSALPLPPFRASLLSLLADFIDSSCNELRADLQDMGAGGQGQGLTRAVSAVTCDTDSDSSYELVSALHLGDDDGESCSVAPIL